MRPDRRAGVLLLAAWASWAGAQEAGDAPAATDPGATGDTVLDRYAARGLESAPRNPILPALIGALGGLAIDAFNGEALQSSDAISAKDDPRQIKQPDDTFELSRRWGALPKISFRTGSGQFGANVFFRQGQFAVVGGFLLGSSDDYENSLSFSWQKPVSETRVLRIGLEVLRVSDTKHRFYGIGAHPETDPRSFFLPGAATDYAIYRHESERVAGIAGLRLSPKLEVFLTGVVLKQQAATVAGDTGPAAFDKVFDVAQLPGVATPSKQFSTELSANYDTRRYRGWLEPGYSVSAYAGPSLGVAGDPSGALRLGSDLAAYLPVLRHDRLIVPRITLDTLTNLRDGVPINFTDFPRQLPFRGVNSATNLLRQDKVVVNGSVEYQWPLARSLSGALFAQTVMVGPTLARLTSSNAPWNGGLKVELHSRDAPVMAAWATWGPNAFYAWFQIGIVERSNDRWRWY